MAPNAKASGKVNSQQLKIVIRRLPPDLPEAIFWKSVHPWVHREEETAESDDLQVSWSRFYAGRKATSRDKEDLPSRAYIMFKTIDRLVAFYQSYDGWSFRDKQGNISRAIVEFAPFQKVAVEPKPDSRQGTVETDNDYLAFQKALVEPEPVVQEVVVQPENLAETTPLLEFLKAQREAKADKVATKKKKATIKEKKKDKEKGEKLEKVEKKAKAKGTSKKGKKKDQVEESPAVSLPTILARPIEETPVESLSPKPSKSARTKQAKLTKQHISILQAPSASLPASIETSRDTSPTTTRRLRESTEGQRKQLSEALDAALGSNSRGRGRGRGRRGGPGVVILSNLSNANSG